MVYCNVIQYNTVQYDLMYRQFLQKILAPVFAEDFSSQEDFAAALEEYERLQSICRGLKQIMMILVRWLMLWLISC